MSLKRRDFLGIAALSSATLVTGKATASEVPAHNPDALGVLVDTAVCSGCRKCEWACNRTHELTDRPMSTFEDKTVFELHRRPDRDAFTVVNQFIAPENPEKPYAIKVQCMHCLRPACVSACIVGALEKTPEGPVIYDAWKCIGCRYCMVACPFQIPAYEYDEALAPQVKKCSFCYERVVKEGKVPACKEICPNEALTFGRRDELIDIAHSRIKNHPGMYYDHVYGEHEVGGTSWLYLTPTDFKNTELPDVGTEVGPDITEPIQHGVFKAFVPPLALYGLLGLAMHQFKGEKDKAEETE